MNRIAMGSQSYIPCCQAGLALGSDYSKTVRSPQYELFIFFQVLHTGNEIVKHSARIELQFCRSDSVSVDCTEMLLVVDNNICMRVIICGLLVSANTRVTHVCTQKNARSARFIFIRRALLFLFIVILFDTQTL